MTTPPSAARQTLICEFITGLESDGIYNKLDLLYVFAAHDSQAAFLNWIDAAFDSTLVTGSFTTDVGIAPSPNIIINTNYAPLTDSTNYASNDGSQGGVWSGSNANGVLVGNRNGSVNNILRGNTTDIRGLIQGTANTITASPPIGFVGDVINSGTVTRFKDGSLIDTQSGTVNSGFDGVSTFYVGARNTNNTTLDIVETSATIQLAYCSSALTPTEMANFYSRWTTYLAGL